MNLIARNSGGPNIIGRPQATRPWYPTARVRPVWVDVYWRYASEVAAAARHLGTFAPGQAIMMPMKKKPSLDLILSVVTVSPNGISSVRELADAHEVLLDAAALRVDYLEQRMAEASNHHAGRPVVATGVRFPPGQIIKGE